MNDSTEVLLIDDNPMDVDLTQRIFRKLGLTCRIEVANNGQQAIDYLLGNDRYAGRDSYTPPDLILLDLKMPGMGGFEVLGTIKSHPALKLLPVIIFSTSNQDRDKLLAYQAGANGYLVKPSSLDEMMQIIRALHDYWLLYNSGPPSTGGDL